MPSTGAASKTHTEIRQTPCSNLKIKTPKLTLEKSLTDVPAKEKRHTRAWRWDLFHLLLTSYWNICVPRGKVSAEFLGLLSLVTENEERKEDLEGIQEVSTVFPKSIQKRRSQL